MLCNGFGFGSANVCVSDEEVGKHPERVKGVILEANLELPCFSRKCQNGVIIRELPPVFLCSPLPASEIISVLEGRMNCSS